ncbi:hypothetical protein F5B20DRAFT_585565 [Whalleya microplaca]|nr:hypothetical protein F5B20DRAFT_585565 [Whalleya microplaca]
MSSSVTPEAQNRMATSFEDHCLVIGNLLKSYHGNVRENWGYRRRSDTRQLENYVVRASHRRIRQRLQYGQKLRGKTLFWALTQPSETILRKPMALLYLDALKNRWQDIGEHLLQHDTLRKLLLDLDEQLRHLEEHEGYGAAYDVTVDLVDRILGDLRDLRSVHKSELTINFLWLHHVYNFPSEPRSSEDQRIHPEAERLYSQVTGTKGFWVNGAKAYLDLILQHHDAIYSLKGLDMKKGNSPFKNLSHIIRTIKITPVADMTSIPRQDRMAPIVDVISSLPRTLRTWLKVNAQSLHIPDLRSHSGWVGSTHPEMQLAALEFLRLERSGRYPGHRGGDTLPRLGLDTQDAVDQFFFKRFVEMPMTQPPCPMCAAMMNRFDSEIRTEAEASTKPKKFLSR